MNSSERWCLITFCPRRGPLRGDIKRGIAICDEHWKMLHEGELDKLEAIKEKAEKLDVENTLLLFNLKVADEKYDAEHKAVMIVEEELRKIDDKLKAINRWENRWGHHITNPSMKDELSKLLVGTSTG